VFFYSLYVFVSILGGARVAVEPLGCFCTSITLVNISKAKPRERERERERREGGREGGREREREREQGEIEMEREAERACAPSSLSTLFHTQAKPEILNHPSLSTYFTTTIRRGKRE
jgi:hypothetical protein